LKHQEELAGAWVGYIYRGHQKTFKMTEVNLIVEHLEKGNNKVFVKLYNDGGVLDTFYTTVDKAFEVCSQWNSFKWRDGMCQTSALIKLTDEEILSLRIA